MDAAKERVRFFFVVFIPFRYKIKIINNKMKGIVGVHTRLIKTYRKIPSIFTVISFITHKCTWYCSVFR